jgi:hypothetical protein
VTIPSSPLPASADVQPPPTSVTEAQWYEAEWFAGNLDAGWSDFDAARSSLPDPVGFSVSLRLGLALHVGSGYGDDGRCG